MSEILQPNVLDGILGMRRLTTHMREVTALSLSGAQDDMALCEPLTTVLFLLNQIARHMDDAGAAAVAHDKAVGSPKPKPTAP